MEEWKECKLGDVLAEKGYIRGPFGSALKRGDMKETGIPVYEQQHAIYQSRDFRFFIDENKFSEMKRFKVETDDLLISCSGTVGKVTIISEDDPKGIISQALLILRCNTNIILPQYLKYFFLSSKGYNSIISRSSGSVQVNLAKRDVIESIPLSLPPLATQQKIAEILSSLDDKIELNNKINANLETQAQAIFKSWFIDFEPFGGKMPEGWKMGKLGDIVEEMLNGDWGKDEPLGTNTEFVYCVRGADIPDVKVGNKGKMPKRYILPKNFESKHLVDGDLVIEISGGSPTQSTGRIAYISQALLNRYEGKMVCTNFCKAIKPKQDYQMFMYYYWQYLYEKNVFFSYENGTTGIKNLDINGILENEEIAIPTIAALSDFNIFCNSVFLQIFSNGAQSEQLSNVRDTLLPKLMNGEITV